MYAGRIKTQPNVEMRIRSKVLSRALDKLGANQWMRQRYYDCFLLTSIGNMFMNLSENGTIQEHDCTKEYFGSYIEGTRTAGMRSDLDCIEIKTNDVIEPNKKQILKINTKIIVVIADMFTPPGYVQLKVYENDLIKEFQLAKEKTGGYFLSNFYADGLKGAFTKLSGQKLDPEKHGPALTNANGILVDNMEPCDVVIAYHCKSIPSFTQEYFSRKRRFSWPSLSTLNIMKSQGCLFVPTGHSQCSENKHNLQWRVSFSFQERHLMFNLNSAQFLCYILLKLVKTSHISPYVELTSYHCKTALFYTIENSASEIWEEEHLLYCFILCLKRLKRWSKKQFCPNYFLPELNLFTGKIKEQDMYKLTDILFNIIDRPLYYLRLIPISSFGELIQLYELESTTSRENIDLEIDTEVSIQLQSLLYRASLALIHSKNIILQKISYNCNDINEIIARHYKWLKALKEMDRVVGIPLDGVTWALPHVSRFLHSSLGSHLGIKAIDTDNVIMKSWYTVTAVYHLWMGLNSDLMSGKMKLATMLLFTGNLNPITLNWLCKSNDMRLQICGCTYLSMFERITFDPTHYEDMFKSSRPRVQQLNASQFLENYLSTCTIFLPSERKLTLYPLQFEMFRSFGCANEFEGVKFHFMIVSNVSLFSCAYLDSNIYYTLLSIYSSGKQKRKQLLKQLFQCSSSDMDMHRETIFNVSSWLASAVKANSKALLFLKRSWDNYDKINKRRPQLIKCKSYKNSNGFTFAHLLF